MISPRINFGAIYFAGNIYCVGGWKDAFTQTCDVFNIAENKWKKIQDIKCEREGISLCVVGEEYLYAFGDVITRGKRTKQVKN